MGKLNYYPTFQERIEEHECNIRMFRDLAWRYRAMGDIEKACELDEDIQAEYDEIAEIKREIEVYNHNVL